MSDDEIILSELSDEELVQQMHDDLYDGLKEEIEEGTNILLERNWAPYKVLTEALVAWLAVLLNSEALAALIVGGVMAAIAIGLGLYGRSRMSSFSLTPRHTVDSIKRDSEVLSERVSG